jgi:Spy/CpxP family protein refolding chaperone
MLKHCVLALMLAGLIAATSASAFPQNKGSDDQQSAAAGEPPEQGHGHRHFDPAKRTDMLTKQLNLTTEQEPKVLEILRSEQSQMEKLRSDSSATPEDRRSKMMEIHNTSNDQIRALLDSSQQKKWDAMQSRREEWRGHKKDGQAPGAVPDSSEQK